MFSEIGRRNTIGRREVNYMQDTSVTRASTLAELEPVGSIEAITDAELELLVAGTAKIGGFEF